MATALTTAQNISYKATLRVAGPSLQKTAAAVTRSMIPDASTRGWIGGCDATTRNIVPRVKPIMLDKQESISANNRVSTVRTKS
jgi:hypothetical protein